MKPQPEPLPVNIDPPTKDIPLGAQFTIAGVKVTGPGRFITNCKPGEETLFVNSKRPSVFKLNGQVAHSKSEYKRRVAQGDPNVQPPKEP